VTSRALTNGALPLEGTILVTGGSGFLGSHLVTRLVGSGCDVVCTTRRLDQVGLDQTATWRACDLADSNAVDALFSSIEPEIVFHVAGLASGVREADNIRPTLNGNLIASINVLMASLAANARRVVLAGSYEEPEGGAVPRSPYAASKAAATAYSQMFALLYELSIVVLRPSMIYGPGQPDTTKLIPYVTRCFLSGAGPVLASGRRPVDWVYVDDVTEAFLAAASAPNVGGEVIDVGSGELHTIREIVELLAIKTQTTTVAEFGGLSDRPAEYVGAADTSRARELLGWEATTSLDEGLSRTVAAVRALMEA
jgi:UDP-glucose 4-epimerase